VVQRVGNNLVQRMVQKEIAESKYLEMVQEVEGEFYLERDGSEQLQEYRLLERYQARAQEKDNKEEASGLSGLHSLLGG